MDRASHREGFIKLPKKMTVETARFRQIPMPKNRSLNTSLVNIPHAFMTTL
jgi:hypothetical protein